MTTVELRRAKRRDKAIRARARRLSAKLRAMPWRELSAWHYKQNWHRMRNAERSLASEWIKRLAPRSNRQRSADLRWRVATMRVADVCWQSLFAGVR